MLRRDIVLKSTLSHASIGSTRRPRKQSWCSDLEHMPIGPRVSSVVKPDSDLLGSTGLKHRVATHVKSAPK